ncbi:MAG: hypothetical protein II196_07585, partial [Spirochaetales bacterium]|nr:hypothetical protein [Spirochaetales bacterium]
MIIKSTFRLFCCWLLLSASTLLFAQEDNSVMIVSQFGGNLGTRFQTGIDLQGDNMPFFAKEDCEVIFMNKKRADSINYPCGNLMLFLTRVLQTRCF